MKWDALDWLTCGGVVPTSWVAKDLGIDAHTTDGELQELATLLDAECSAQCGAQMTGALEALQKIKEAWAERPRLTRT